MRLIQRGYKLLLTVLLLGGSALFVRGQECPPNIDFESGTFDNWTCYTGFVTGNGQNIISLSQSGPLPGRHTMMNSFPGDGLDPYGGFPVNCPNGSNHSIRLGNDQGGGEAEGISYEFTIPADRNYYTLIYHYAVVFQDPNHEEYQQPRMEIEITNLTDNNIIGCSSFTFVPYGSSILPGFFQSPNPGTETPVWCKDWTAVSISLDGHAGKRIRLFFKTADCTFRRHFGYAYIDVNSECSGTFVGAAYCPDDAFINVQAPYGYQTYTWYNNSFTQTLGGQQVLTLMPPPPTGTTIAVQVIPYSGYGCLDTFYAQLLDTLTVQARAGPDRLSCNREAVQIGSPPRPGLVYRWSPVAGLSNPDISNPHANPAVTTTYILRVNHDGGGCVSYDTVTVEASIIDDRIDLLGKDAYCLGRNDSAVLMVRPTDSIQWYRGDNPIPGANSVRYPVTEGGIYYAHLFNRVGCDVATASKTIQVGTVPVASINAGNAAQCLVGNRFVFTNSSTNVLGGMVYHWSLGDGTTAVSRDVEHSFYSAGVYTVKMVVSSIPVCRDSVEFVARVFQNPVADFAIKTTCIDLPVQAVDNTLDTMDSPIHYLWDLGNGSSSTLRTPPSQVYHTAANYPITLSVYSDQCPTPVNTMRQTLKIEKPRPAVEYPVQYAVINYPLNLQARNFGETVEWSPGTFLNNPDVANPTFLGNADQNYTIKLTTASGCVTVDTQSVKTVKEAQIYVPSAFTPNDDGLNDVLRPIFMGIRELHYFRVYNRWGQLLYERKTELPGWDGKVAGMPQPSQVVVWMVEGLSVDNRLIKQKGTSTLVR